MQSARKVTLIPPKENQIGGSIEEHMEETAESGSISLPVEKSLDKIKSKIYDKIHRFIKIILKLARSVGYDDDLKIKLKNGKYLEKSNIVDLLTHAMSAGKVLYGENEFIELLADSDVDPDLIINANVRNKLIQFRNKNKKATNTEVNPESSITLINKDQISPKRLKLIKRGNKRYVIEEDEPINKIIEVNRDGPTIEIDPSQDFIRSGEAIKRKAPVIEDEDSIDDEAIDSNRWIVN